MKCNSRFIVGACLSITLLTAFLVIPASPQSAGAGQTQKEVLTNTSVIELVKLGLSDALVIEKIRQSEHNFDTSVEGLRQLKAARVSETVIREMMSPRLSGAAAPPASTPIAGNTVQQDESDPLASREPGIYVANKGRVVQIHPTSFSGTKSNFLGAAFSYGLAKSKMRATVRGASANLTVAQLRPEFYFHFDEDMSTPGLAMTSFTNFSAASPAEFVLVKMDRKSNSRETVLMEIGMFGSSTGARDKDVREFTFEKLKSGVFKVTPKVNLDPGEYCFYFAGVAGAYGIAGGKLFDFGITLPAM
ncbi:MAG: hypothetical protein ACREEM_47955 [Blastocatellia bacterium]